MSEAERPIHIQGEDCILTTKISRMKKTEERERETQNYWHMSNLDRNYRINCDILGNARARVLILVSLRKRRAVQIGNNLTLAEKGRLLKL